VTSRQRSDDSVWGGPKVALGAVLAGAAALRLVGLEYGLPHGNLLNPGEANVVPRAWAMTHGSGLDPHPFFDHPSLLLYVLAPFQWWEDEPSYVAARLVAVAIGLLGVAAAWWLGSRAYGVVAGGVAAAATGVATVHVGYSRMAVTDVLLTTLVTVALALLVSGRIELAGLVAGVATAAKVPGIVLAVPILVLVWGQWRRALTAAGLAVVGFAAATPFALVHLGELVDDTWRLVEHARAGWLGFENDHSAPVAFVDRLWESLGPFLIVAAVGLVAALVVRAPADRALAAFALAYYATLLPLGSHFDRYVLPLIPVLGALAGRLRALAAVTLLLLAVPLTWSVRATDELTREDARAAAVPLVERAGPSPVVAADPGLPKLRVALVRLRLPSPWAEPDPLRDLRELRAAVPGVTHVWVNGSVADRVRAARDEYPNENAFYDALEREGRLVFRLDDSARFAGPWTALYWLPDR